MSGNLDEIVGFKQLVLKLIKHKYLVIFSLIISFIIAFAYNRYSVEYFDVETSLLLQDDDRMSTVQLYENSFKNENLENKALLINSFPLIYKTLEDLRFDIVYYIEGNIKVTETFNSPFIIKCNNTSNLKGKKIKLKYHDEDSFIFIDLSNDKEQIKNLNEKFFFEGQQISVEYNIDFNSGNSDIPNTIVKFQSLNELTKKYKKKINIDKISKESTVLKISMLTKDEEKGVNFLNKLVDNFIEDEINEKNLASNNTIQFINDQLKEMSDSLALIEQQIQQYKNVNQITDLSLKAQSIYTNIVGLETELAKARTLNNYYEYLENYIGKGENLERISVPTSFGVNDVNLASLINQLIEIQIKKNILIDGGQINNPAISQYNRQTKQLILNIQEAIKTSKKTNDLLITDYNNRIYKMDQSLSNIPEVEMELLNIERLQSISENIYVFLLQKRAEAKIDLSSNVADSKILERAIYYNKKATFPNKGRTYVIGLLFGLLIPILYLIIREFLNNKVLTKLDLEKLTNIKVLAVLARNYSGNVLLSNHNPKSFIYEGFRALRFNLNLLNKDNLSRVYLITSSTSGEGKTYIAENLSIVFARSGKKTLVIGGDLRRPKLYTDFGLNNNIGISNYINSDVDYEQLIHKSEISNLDILIAGPLPSNPSDTLLDPKFKSLMEKLKDIYDIIIIDTPPLGLVTDALTLMKYSDVNLYVVRQGKTKKNLLSYVQEMNINNRLGEIYTIFNDLKESTDIYGHYYNYGYYTDNEYFSDNKQKL
tara:strand:+ start:163 stop:2466 length:2304 start_codon:yes stop_codon:yes gene_type:complete